MKYWILDSWLVHPGREEEFVAAWTDLIQWTMQQVPGKVSGVPLYRDSQQRNRFFCPMVWESVEAIEEWRASQGYQSRIEHIEQLCAEREARTLEEVTYLTPKEKEAMSTQHNKQLVQRWKDEIWNKRNLNIIDELYSPDHRGQMASTPIPGREALKQLLAAYFAAFGDIHLTTQFLIAEGDMVVAYDTIRLKHTGVFQGIPPTGKEASFTSTDIYRIVDGKIVEQWTEGDMLGLLQQLGVISAPGQASE